MTPQNASGEGGGELLALAARCEAASGPDRELDAGIACLIGKPLGNINHWLHGPDISYRPTAYGYYDAVLPDGTTSEGFASKEYTASLDAAITLVPEGCDYVLDNFDGDRTGFRCSAGVFMRGDWIDCKGAATPALALTAACLRARAIPLNAKEIAG